MTIRERAEYVLDITEKRFDQLLPGMMRETGLDMWIVIGNEDDHDPLFWTMAPYKNWSPITQILVFYDRGPGEGVERLNVSRTNTQGLYENAWDAAAWDNDRGESQWECLGRVVRERDPQRIGINEGEIQKFFVNQGHHLQLEEASEHLIKRILFNIFLKPARL